jgi:hypothetical protein
MSSNPYTNYYVNQAGSGLAGYKGVRFQRGNGLFTDIFKNALMPILRYLGKRTLETGTGIYEDAIKGENILQSTKKRFKKTAQEIAGDVAERATRFAQTGEGRKKQRGRRAGAEEKAQSLKAKPAFSKISLNKKGGGGVRGRGQKALKRKPGKKVTATKKQKKVKKNRRVKRRKTSTKSTLIF